MSAVCRYDALSHQALLFKQSDQQPLGSFGIAAGLDDFVDNVIVLKVKLPEPLSFNGLDGRFEYINHLIDMCPCQDEGWRDDERIGEIADQHALVAAII